MGSITGRENHPKRLLVRQLRPVMSGKLPVGTTGSVVGRFINKVGDIYLVTDNSIRNTFNW